MIGRRGRRSGCQGRVRSRSTTNEEITMVQFFQPARSARMLGSLLLGAGGVCGAALAQSQGAPAAASALVNEPTISLNAAMDLASTALARCRADGYKVTVTVLNRHARTAVVLSDDGVNPHTVENSLRKAYTAFTTKSPSVEMGKRAQPNLMGFLLLDKTTTIEGGLPILVGKEIVGAVGISGAPGGEKDAACAQAGIDKIAKGLSGG
jgi:uncharacterized protein GlcG (DUF336 family)